MQRLLIGGLIWLIVLPVYAQEATPWKSGCSQEAEAVIAPIIGEDLYTAGCAALQMCLRELDLPAPGGCEFPVYDALRALCEGDLCDLQSRFYMASLLIFEQLRSVSIYVYDPTDIQTVIADILLAFQANDYQRVIDLYAEVLANLEYDTNKSPFLDYIVGLMYEQLGDPEAAALAYRASIELYRMPFVTMQRAEVLIQLGHEDTAAAEALMMGDIPQAEVILSAQPLPDELMENWNAYPTTIESAGNPLGGEDYTIVPGVPFQLVSLSDGSLLLWGAIATLVPDGWSFDGFVEADAVLLYPDETGYKLNSYLSPSWVSLSFEENIGTLHFYVDAIHRPLEKQVLIAPANLPDPRGASAERCEGGARWRLTVGGQGTYVQPNGKGVQYYDALEGETAGIFNPELSTFRVVSGPVCIASQAWWEIELQPSDGKTYWLPEAEAPVSEEYSRLYGLHYFAVPIEAP